MFRTVGVKNLKVGQLLPDNRLVLKNNIFHTIDGTFHELVLLYPCGDISTSILFPSANVYIERC